MRIILEVDEFTVGLSITTLRIDDEGTHVGARCFDIRGANGKTIVIPKEGKPEIKEADEDARAD